MRIKHRYPVDRMRFTDDVSAEYQAEVDRQTARRERDYEAASRRLQAAQSRRERIEHESVSKTTREKHARRLAAAIALVEVRRLELERIDQQMRTSPQAAQHRGTGSFRPVPINQGGNL